MAVKKPSLASTPLPQKQPRFASDPNAYWDARPSWRISIVETRNIYGWHELDADTLQRVRERISSFETMTWREIITRSNDQHHAIPFYRLCADAQRRLRELRLDDQEKIISLRITARERVFGFLDQGALQLLWWDPDHLVCPSIRREGR